MMKKTIAFILTLVFILSLAGCGKTEREYYEDIIVPLQDASGQIIIKEWRYLQGSGAEVYYQKENSEPVLLGKTTGADDGFCPFKEGLYEITQDGNSITVKWCFHPVDKDKTDWRGRTFDLPSNENGEK